MPRIDKFKRGETVWTYSVGWKHKHATVTVFSCLVRERCSPDEWEHESYDLLPFGKKRDTPYNYVMRASSDIFFTEDQAWEKALDFMKGELSSCRRHIRQEIRNLTVLRISESRILDYIEELRKTIKQRKRKNGRKRK